MITLKDVAREAGVSIATVSCALSGKKAVQQYGKRVASGNEEPVLLRAL